MAAEIDTMEDKLRELIHGDAELEEHVARRISELGVEASEETMRVVVAIAAGVLRKADDRGEIRAMFGTAAPLREDLREFSQMLMETIDGDRNRRLQGKCVDFVLGLGLNGGVNQTAIGKEEWVTKATVSKRCRNLKAQLGRERVRGMRSEEACRVYSARQKGKRARPAREPWTFSGLLTSVFGAGQPALTYGA